MSTRFFTTEFQQCIAGKKHFQRFLPLEKNRCQLCLLLEKIAITDFNQLKKALSALNSVKKVLNFYSFLQLKAFR
jgi:hypothetical protein